MRGFPAALLLTAQLIYFALFRATGAAELPAAPACELPGQAKSGRASSGAAEPLSCTPRQIKGGVGRLVNSQGELRLFFPGCLAIAAPLILFRLKREGFSRCSVEASDQGLLVRGRR